MAVAPGEGIKKESSGRGPKSRGHIEFYAFCNEKKWLELAPGTDLSRDVFSRFNPTGPT